MSEYGLAFEEKMLTVELDFVDNGRIDLVTYELDENGETKKDYEIDRVLLIEMNA